MKPIYLEVSAFGPFAGQVTLPFQQVVSEGVFLIYGATGAGKTTIFDAISFALFGTASGENRPVDSFRSDFAEEDCKTYVILEFTHGKEFYKIERSPAYRRKKQRGEGYTDNRAEAVLTMPDGSKIIGYQTVTEKMEEILCVDYRQFKQISMIAQGEFIKLLTVESKERGEILRTVFHTDEIGRIGKELKERMLLAKRSCEEADRSMIQYYSEIDNSVNHPNKEKIEEFFKNKTVYLTEGFQDILFDMIKQDKEEQTQRNIYLSCLERELTEKKVEEAQKVRWKEKRKEYAVLEKQIEEYTVLVEKLRTKAKMEQNRKETLQELYQKRRELEARQKELDMEWKEAEQVRQRSILVEVKKEKYEGLTRKILELLKRKAVMGQKLQQMENAYTCEQAGLLAKTLRPGKPCPVCGSLEHPNPMQMRQGVPSEKEIKRQRKEYEELRTTLETLGQEAASEKSAMELLLEQLGIQNDANEGWNQFLKKKEEWKGTVDELEKERKEKTEQLKHLKRELEEEEQAKKEWQNAQEEFANAQEKLIRDKERISYLTQELAEEKPEWKEENSECLMLLEKEKEELLRDITKVATRIKINEKIYENAAQQLLVRQQAQKDYHLISILSDVANGELSGKDRLPFEQYVQAFYFEQVISEANLRLKRMSSGRYALKRRTEAQNRRSITGLDLEIMDYFTGKTRSVKSLSGGESFKAALALALGLSDVIQRHAGGILVETLFVDEGFGSLDKDSLEQSVQILQELADGHRMVGIISHVEELKECIEKKIWIKKESQGSTVELERNEGNNRCFCG